MAEGICRFCGTFSRNTCDDEHEVITYGGNGCPNIDPGSRTRMMTRDMSDSDIRDIIRSEMNEEDVKRWLLVNGNQWASNEAELTVVKNMVKLLEGGSL